LPIFKALCNELTYPARYIENIIQYWKELAQVIERGFAVSRYDKIGVGPNYYYRS